MKQAKFNVGDIVIHQSLKYRAIIIDIDPLFQPSGHPNPQALKRPFATRNPWYRLLVDDTAQITYVEEPLLIKDENHAKINHPELDNYLIQDPLGYRATHRLH